MTHDRNRNQPVYRVDLWNRAAMFAVIDTREGLTAKQARMTTEQYHGTNTAYRVYVNNAYPHADMTQPVCESYYHPQLGWIDAPINPTQYDVYQERTA